MRDAADEEPSAVWSPLVEVTRRKTRTKSGENLPFIPRVGVRQVRLITRRLAFNAILCFTRAMPKQLLAFVDDIYEDLELWYPKLRLEEAGFTTRLVATELKTFTGKHGYPAKADLLLSDVQAGDFDGLLIPGGFMPDKLRRHERVLSLTREMFEAGKLVAFICHGGWIPISAKIVRGKKVTGSRGIKDDLENAGGVWVDAPVVVDGNLVSSRTPLDLAPFAKAMVDFLGR